MKKIIFAVLVLISFVACSNGSTSHNDEPVYMPTPAVSDNSSAQVDDEYYMRYYDFYTCDYWLLIDNSNEYHGEIYHHYVATESNPTEAAIDFDIVCYDKNQNLIQTRPGFGTFNLKEGWFGGNPDEGHIGVRIHKVGRDWLDDNGNMVLKYCKTKCVDLRDPGNPTWKVFD
jgi:hypothetical protein